jgi:hypothetical protein
LYQEHEYEEQRRTNRISGAGDWGGRYWAGFAQKPIDRDSIVDELVRLGRQKGDGVEDEVFVKAADLVRKGSSHG